MKLSGAPNPRSSPPGIHPPLMTAAARPTAAQSTTTGTTPTRKRQALVGEVGLVDDSGEVSEHRVVEVVVPEVAVRIEEAGG
jgi:hypothetical protein